MANKLGDKIGQIDIHKTPKSSPFGETVAGIFAVVFWIFVIAGIFG